MKQLPLIASVLVALLLIGGATWLAAAPSAPDENSANAVSVVDGTQYIDMTAKGGYSPRVVAAKAGLPTVIRMRTNGTFDCSAALVIPKLSYQKFLPPSGTEEIAIAAAQAQGTLQGLCSMGMYGFQIRFE